MIKFSNFSKEYIIFFLSFLSLFYSFLSNHDGTGGGASGDFEATYGFILALQESLFANPNEWTLVHTPLHFIILSYVTRVIDDSDTLRLIFLIFSISIPYIFYVIVSKFILKNKNKKNLILIISCCIFFIPSFRYTSVWCNNLITSIFFFLISIFFFEKWKEKLNKELNKNLLLQIFFLFLATYTRQYFAVFFLYFLKKYYEVLPLKNFIKLFLICILSSLPVFFYVYKFPSLLTEQHMSIYAVNYFLLGNSAIIFTTLFPIIMINFLYKKIPCKKILIPSIISFCLVYILSLNFDGYGWQGGGVSFLFSKKIFNNNIFFYFLIFFTIAVFIYLFLENRSNFVILLTLLFMFFSFQVYQRYYDPMFFIVFFLMVKTDLINIFIKKKMPSYLLLLYFVLFYLITASKLIYRYSFNI